MADNTSNTTRRAILGALAAAPLVMAAPAIAATSIERAGPTHWDIAYANYQAVCAKASAFDPQLHAINKAYKTDKSPATHAAYEVANDKAEALAEKESEAGLALLKTPTINGHELAEKIKFMVSHNSWGLVDEIIEPALTLMQNDAARLGAAT